MRLHALIWPWLPHVIRAVYRLEVSGSRARPARRRAARRREPPLGVRPVRAHHRRRETAPLHGEGGAVEAPARSAGRWTSSEVFPSAAVAATVRRSTPARASSAQVRPWGCSRRVTSVAKGRGSGAPRRWRSRRVHPSCRFDCSTPIAPSRPPRRLPEAASSDRRADPVVPERATVAAARDLTDRFRAAHRGARRPRLTPRRHTRRVPGRRWEMANQDPPQRPADPAVRKANFRRIVRLFRQYRRAAHGRLRADRLLRRDLGVVSPFLLREVLDAAIPDENVGLLTVLVAGMIAISLDHRRRSASCRRCSRPRSARA